MDRKDTPTTHNAYFDHLETDGPGTRRGWSPLRTRFARSP